VELGEEAAAGVLRLLDPVVQLVELLRRCYGGQAGPGIADGEELQWRIDLTCGGVPVKFRHRTARGRGWPARGTSWAQDGASTVVHRGGGGLCSCGHDGADGSVRRSRVAVVLGLGGGLGEVW
jgi:hypothetical protein